MMMRLMMTQDVGDDDDDDDGDDGGGGSSCFVGSCTGRSALRRRVRRWLRWSSLVVHVIS